MSEARPGLPGAAGADLERIVQQRLGDLPADAPPGEQLTVLEELHGLLAQRLGEASG